MNHQDLAQSLLQAVRAQGFESTADRMRHGAPVEAFPSIDLAVAAFTPGQAPVWANVLFSREHPQGLIAEIGLDAGPVRNVRFMADLQDEEHVSVAWQPGADWLHLNFKPLTGPGPHRFVAPYPASLIKLMVMIGLARAVDAGHAAWDQALGHLGETRRVDEWAFDMIALSCNRSTNVMVAHLHALGYLGDESSRPHAIHRLFLSLGLPSLRLANTRADGGWINSAGAGVGQLQVTAWDTLRLLWLIDPDAPPAPWLAADQAPLLAESRAHVLHCLRGQRHNHVLSSRSLRGLPGWVPGIPDEGACFAHKTGNTENYCSDAGIVNIQRPHPRHYLIALTSNLGFRYASHPDAFTTWKLPALGAAIDALMQ